MDIPSSPERIASVGSFPLLTPCDQLDLFSPQHIEHYDTILLSVAAIIKQLQQQLNINVLDNVQVNSVAFNRASEKIIAKLDTITRLVKSGASVILFFDYAVPTINLVTGGKVMGSVSLLTFPLFNLLPSRPLQGDAVEYCGPKAESHEPIFSKRRMAYLFQLDSPKLEPILQTPSRLGGKPKIVAGFHKVQAGTGGVLVVPPLRSGPDVFADSEYLLSLCDLAKNLAASGTSPAAPQWAKDLWLKAEASIASDSHSIRLKIAALQGQLEESSQKMAEAAWQRDLYIGTSSALEKAVLRALSEIGIKAAAGPSGRADIVGSIDGLLFAAEIKGYEGGAKEAAIAQCVRWRDELEAVFALQPDEWDKSIHEYHAILKSLGVTTDAKTERSIKGLIIANVYREQPLQGRPSLTDKEGEVFSDPFQVKLAQKEIVAITGVQLLGALDKFRNEPHEGAKWFAGLLRKPGARKDFMDWREFLSEVNLDG